MTLKAQNKCTPMGGLKEIQIILELSQISNIKVYVMKTADPLLLYF